MEELEWMPIDLEKKDWPKNGEMISIKQGQKKYCLGKHGEEFFLVDYKCPHAGGILSDGRINEHGQIVCPNHRYVFDPHTGKNTSGQGFYCEHYWVKVENEKLYLGQKKLKSIWNFLGLKKS